MMFESCGNLSENQASMVSLGNKIPSILPESKNQEGIVL